MSPVALREWRREDAAAIAALVDDPHLRRWSSLPQLGAQRWIAQQRAGERGPSLAICATDDPDRPLGKIALRLPGHASPATSCAAMSDGDQPAGELSYWILPQARGRGLATAAVTLMLGRARELGGVSSVVLDIELENLASLRVAERLGAQRREPTRVEVDRTGVQRTLVVFVITL